jgi:hypothetical protein
MLAFAPHSEEKCVRLIISEAVSTDSFLPCGNQTDTLPSEDVAGQIRSVRVKLMRL